MQPFALDNVLKNKTKVLVRKISVVLFIRQWSYCYNLLTTSILKFTVWTNSSLLSFTPERKNGINSYRVKDVTNLSFQRCNVGFCRWCCYNILRSHWAIFIYLMFCFCSWKTVKHIQNVLCILSETAYRVNMHWTFISY